MLIFTLAPSCLTTSNLPCFMDLTFQIHIQYCSLQHLSLLLPPDMSTTGHCFHFGSASSFLLEQYLHSSSVTYCVPTDLGSSSSTVMSFCLFILLHTFHSAGGPHLFSWSPWLQFIANLNKITFQLLPSEATPLWVYNLQAYPVDFRLIISTILWATSLITHLCVCVYIAYWFCFFREPWLRQSRQLIFKQ